MYEKLIAEGFLEPIDLYYADMHHPNDENGKALLTAVMQSARQGHLCLDLENIEGPAEWIVAVKMGATQSFPQLVYDEKRVYLEKNYLFETEILQELKRLIGPSHLSKIDANLTDEQQAAFDLVRSENISIIEGGPGTGKTYLTTELVKSFGPSAQIILAAPTGKATYRLKKNNPHAICKTVHSLLGMKEKTFIQADLIVVDEASMLDVKMLRQLLKSVPTGQRLVFLGDGNQLPPIESGSLFNDLIDLIPTAHLTNSLRSDRKEILDLASSILQGIPPTPHGPLSYESIKNFSVTILTPLRDGPLGVKTLNALLEGSQEQTPIMITRNDPQTGLSNGDTGLLISPNMAQFDDKIFPISELPPFESAYALSIHKSQGSEFDHVMVLAPPGTEVFGREILYTAVTRARQSVVLLGDTEVIKKTIQTTSTKRSGINQRFKL